MNTRPLFPILDSAFIRNDDWVTPCKALIDGGADMIEFRAKDFSFEQCIKILDTLVPFFEGIEAPFIINDDIDLCLHYPKLGLHVGQDDLDPAEARERIGPDRLLGLSTHSVKQAQGAIAQQGILDYFAVGPVYATATKPEYTQVGLELVRAVADLNPPLPFYCIGGIKRSNTKDVITAGGEGVCVISDLLNAQDITAATRDLKNLLSQ